MKRFVLFLLVLSIMSLNGCCNKKKIQIPSNIAKTTHFILHYSIDKNTTDINVSGNDWNTLLNNYYILKANEIEYLRLLEEIRDYNKFK